MNIVYKKIVSIALCSVFCVSYNLKAGYLEAVAKTDFPTSLKDRRSISQFLHACKTSSVLEPNFVGHRTEDAMSSHEPKDLGACKEKFQDIYDACCKCFRGYDIYEVMAQARRDNYQKVVESSYDASYLSSDSRFRNIYNVFMRIQNDLGLQGKVALRLLVGDHKLFDDLHIDSAQAFYVPETDTVFLKLDNWIVSDFSKNKKYRDCYASCMIFTLTHELQHARQELVERYYAKKSSTNFLSQGSTNFLPQARERNADEVAARYIACWKCLTYVSFLPSEHNKNSGYMTQDDFKPYIEKAKENNCLCKAHNPDASCEIQEAMENYLPTKV